MKGTSQSGQITVEMVLILFVFVGMTQFVISEFDRFKPLVKFVGEPWKVVSGMMEFGIWKNPGDISIDKHPSHWNRMYGMQGEPPPR